MIPRVPKIARLHRVPVPHTNEATYVIDEAGRRWVAKREMDMGFEALLAEALTWMLGRELGAPVPDAAFCDDPGERAWLSSVVPMVSHWTPRVAGRIQNIEDLGAVMALDILVLNEARHARNLLIQARADQSLWIWAIDADEALVGHPDDFERRLQELPSVHNHARGIPVDRISEAARAAAVRAEHLDPNRIASFAAEACDIAGETRHGHVADLVQRRAGAVPKLMTDYVQELRQLR